MPVYLTDAYQSLQWKVFGKLSKDREHSPSTLPAFEGALCVCVCAVNPDHTNVPADMLCCDKSSRIVSIILPYAILSDML